ncbi:MAG: Gfo/Idh/MocA family oxidoreductase [Candidatus Marinimicrobia bacterium]|nr:Gfo/Idh/MocA family oxidoreductase [Candidatus Neomarinimicrobiota bacterium]
MKDQVKQIQRPGKPMSRGEFLGRTAIAAAVFTIVPRHVLGGPGYRAPSDTLNIAGIGVGGMGKNNVRSCAEGGQNIVALCDVDRDYAAPVFKEYPKAKVYTDYRRMLDKQKDIDAVIIATPDHTHAVIAMAAMRAGKHVYVQKPLTHSVYETRMLTEAAHEYKVVTQMGNQGHSWEGDRLISEWIWDGAIGDVREVHAWTNRPIWPQGIDRPQDKHRVPKTMDWDLWLGPAPYRPYHPAYAPFKWRGWWDFGTGALGDMACHIMDPVFWALKLHYPTSVEASATEVNSETAPLASIVRYEFPARGTMPPVKFSWYDGGMMPPRPDDLEDGRHMGDRDGGVIFIGDKGKLMCGAYGKNPRLIPEPAMKAYTKPSKTIPRIETSHEMDWVRACKGGEPASSNFDVSGPLTETVLMGNLAIRSLGNRLQWDGLNMQVTNVEEANQYVRREYRDGWSL